LKNESKRALFSIIYDKKGEKPKFFLNLALPYIVDKNPENDVFFVEKRPKKL